MTDTCMHTQHQNNASCTVWHSGGGIKWYEHLTRLYGC